MTHSRSGSYDRIQCLSYLDAWLGPWSEVRAAANDYCILYSDVAAGHIGDDVDKLCWSKGYVYLLHYGGTTAIIQVNDTDCHFYLEGVCI